MGVSIAFIKKINGIGNDDFLYPGRKIRLVENVEPVTPPPQPIVNDSLKIPKDPLVQTSHGRRRSKSTVDEWNVLDDNIQKDIVVKSDSSNEDNKENEASLEELKSKLRSSLAAGGNISNIDKIFEHVLNESK